MSRLFELTNDSFIYFQTRCDVKFTLMMKPVSRLYSLNGREWNWFYNHIDTIGAFHTHCSSAKEKPTIISVSLPVPACYYLWVVGIGKEEKRHTYIHPYSTYTQTSLDSCCRPAACMDCLKDNQVSQSQRVKSDLYEENFVVYQYATSLAGQSRAKQAGHVSAIVTHKRRLKVTRHATGKVEWE